MKSFLSETDKQMQTLVAAEHWIHRADISWVLHKSKMDNVGKADKIRKYLEGLAPFQDNPEHISVLEELQEAAKQGNTAFDEALDVLFVYCDFYRIWISS